MKKQRRKIRKKKTARGKGKDEELTFKEERFCLEYIKNYEGRQSAIKAGYGEKGAHVRSSELLQKPKIKDAIAKLQKKIADKCEITKEKVLRDLEETRLKAMENKRFAPAHRCSELQGKSIQLFIDKTIIGEDRDNPFGAEERKQIEEGLLRKLERLAGGRRSVIDIEPLEEKPMITLIKRRTLKHIRKRHAVNKSNKQDHKRKYFSEPEPEEELDFDDPDFVDAPEEEFVPTPNRFKNRKASFADFDDLSESAMEKGIMDDDIFS